MHWRHTAAMQEVGASILCGPGVVDRIMGQLRRKSNLFEDLRIDHGEDWISIFAASLAGHGAEEGEAILPDLGGIALYEEAAGWWLPVGVEIAAPRHVRGLLRQALATRHDVQPPAIVVPRFAADTRLSDSCDLYALNSPRRFADYRIAAQEL